MVSASHGKMVRTSMNDLSAMEIGQPIQDTFCDLAQDFLSSATSKLFDLFINAVQTSTFTELHGNRDGARGFIHESTVVTTDVVRGAVFVEVKLTNNLFLDIWVWIRSNDLEWGVSFECREQVCKS